MGKIINQREGFIDNAKGIGIILVILGHLSISRNIYNFIYAFHMPLFIFLSGMVFHSSKIKKNIYFLSSVYFIISSLVSIPWYLLHFYLKKDFYLSIKKCFFSILGGGAAPFFRIDPSPALWFLTALIVIEIISYYLEKVTNDIKYVIIILLIGVGVMLAEIKTKSFIPWNIDVAFFLLPFFELGRISFHLIKNICMSKMIKFCLAFVSLGCVYFISNLNGTVNIYRCIFGSSLFLYYINSFLGIYGILLLSMCLPPPV